MPSCLSLSSPPATTSFPRMSARRPTASESRRGDFKNQGLTQDEFRRRREETSVELRKAKKEDSLNKRRSILDSALKTSTTTGTSTNEPEDYFSNEAALDSDSSLLIDLQKASRDIYSPDLTLQLEAVTEFRKKLSKEKNPPIKEVLDYGVTPRFVELLVGPASPADSPEMARLVEKIQFEAAWALTNIASGTPEQTEHVVKLGTVPVFISHLMHANPELRDQCIWALGNIAGDCAQMRDLVLANHIMYPLLTNLSEELNSQAPRISIIQNGTWTLSNLCRGRPLPEWNEVAVALPVLARILMLDDPNTLADACWCLSYLSDVPPDQVERLDEVLRTGVVPRLIELLSFRVSLVRTPALRAIGNIVTGNEYQTQAVIDAGGLVALKKLLNETRIPLQKEACWAISNITAGTSHQIQAVIEADIFPKLIHLLAYADTKVKREACWAICNATSMYAEVPDQVRYLVREGCIKPLCDLLRTQDIKMILVALGGLSNILEVGDMDAAMNDQNINPYSLLIEDCGGLDTISELQAHSNDKVYEEAKQIIDKYYQDDVDAFNLLGEDGAHDSLDYSAPSGGFNF